MNKLPTTSPSTTSISKATQSKPSFPVPTFIGEAQPSVIPSDVRHVIFATGFRGSGKTHFLLGIDRPENILFLDYESKGEGLARGYGIQNYFSVNDDCAETLGFGFRPIAIYERTKQIIEAVPEGRFTTIILDNASFLQDGALAEVQKQPHLYGIDPQRAMSGRFGGAWPGVKFILYSLFSILRQKGISVIGVSFQLSKAWGDAGPLLNKFKTTDVALWHEHSVLTVVMVPGMPEHLPFPSALVMKEQLSTAKWDDETGEMRVTRRLPLKLPKASMSEVYRYLREPANFKAPRPGEMPAPGEVEPYSPSFSREQLTIMTKLAEAAKAMAEAEPDTSAD